MNVNYDLNAGRLTLHIKGRLDTFTSFKFETDIIEVCKDNPHTSLVLDASELVYIASSGLRVIMKMAKAEKNFSIVNVKPEVYDVFEMTGFSRIMKIEKALRKIDISNCTLAAKGARGVVYRISEDELVKVLNNPEDNQSLYQELIKAKDAFLLGVPTAISFDLVDCGDGKKGIIYETIKSKSVGELIQDYPNRMEELVEKYVSQLNILHNIHTYKPVFDNAKNILREQIEKARKYFSEEEMDKLNDFVDALPDGDSLIHGDAHPKNLMVQGDELMWIDMEMMCLGHPLFDLISIASVIKITTSDEIAIQLTGMDMENLKKFGQLFIRKFFKVENEEMFARYEKYMDILRMLRRVSSVGIEYKNADILRPRTLAALRKEFFPHIEQFKEDISQLSHTLSITM